MGEHWIKLDDYEIANLRAALEAIIPGRGALPSPLNALHSGDWTGQVYAKLPPVGQWPNQPAESMAAIARRWEAPDGE